VMEIECFLIVASTGSVRVTKRDPDLKWNEIVVKIALRLPRALFSKPTIEARVLIPDEAAKPATISAEVIERVDEAIRAATGMHVELIVRSPEDQ
jgi:hypothetical protein